MIVWRWVSGNIRRSCPRRKRLHARKGCLPDTPTVVAQRRRRFPVRLNVQHRHRIHITGSGSSAQKHSPPHRECISNVFRSPAPAHGSCFIGGGASLPPLERDHRKGIRTRHIPVSSSVSGSERNPSAANRAPPLAAQSLPKRPHLRMCVTLFVQPPSTSRPKPRSGYAPKLARFAHQRQCAATRCSSATSYRSEWCAHRGRIEKYSGKMAPCCTPCSFSPSRLRLPGRCASFASSSTSPAPPRP